MVLDGVNSRNETSEQCNLGHQLASDTYINHNRRDIQITTIGAVSIHANASEVYRAVRWVKV